MPAPGDQYGDVKNPFEEVRVDQFSAQEIATLQSRLNKQLGPEYISQRPGNGGGRVAYLEGNKAIALANEVFGFNGWSSSLGQVQIDYVDENTQNGKVCLGLSIVVRITLKGGTYHEDIGYGSVENGKGKAASFEKAKKEAATDGLKRALRTFGNVLGNCLYDKDYLKKVQSMKVKPIRFKEENLYRHVDFAPPPKGEEEVSAIKREPHRTPAKSNGTLRTRTGHLNGSMGGEFDDDDDGNLFDGVELAGSNADDSMSEEPAPKALETAQPSNAPSVLSSSGASYVKNGGPPQRPPNQRMQTAPNGRGQNGVQQSHPPQNQQSNASGRPPANLQNSRGPPTPAQGNRRPPPTVDIHAVPKPPNAPLQAQANQPLRPTPPQQQQQVKPGGPATTTPARPPVGFVTSRAAELLQNSESAASSLTNLPAFNPHAESPVPKAQRTPGVDYTRSIPIKRGEISAPPLAAPNLGPAANTSNNGGGSAFTRPGPGARGNTNFVNPAQDMNRRIGMPGAGAGAGGGMNQGPNRSAYKPPMKRPPLSDVSNQRGESDEPDPKRQKVEPGSGPENGGPGVVES